jgi:hypothetical protein
MRLSLDPSTNAVVWSVDEKSGMQAKSRVNPAKPAVPGAPVRREFEYRRHGTAGLFAALDVHAGDIAGSPTRPARSYQFANLWTPTGTAPSRPTRSDHLNIPPAACSLVSSFADWNTPPGPGGIGHVPMRGFGAMPPAQRLP